MKKHLTFLTCMLTALICSNAAFAGGGNKQFDVTITNLTRSQTFTPILVASLRKPVSMFTLGDPASDELSALAEGGAVGPMTLMLEANPRVIEVANSGGLLAPGASVTVTVSAKGAKHISVASMLIPTNDAFVALNSVAAPKGKRSVTYMAPAYDAGSEPNDEWCYNIPGPVCMGTGPSPGVGGEDYVHIHSGIHGIGDLLAEDYDWRNPVASITVRKVSDPDDDDEDEDEDE